MGGARHAQGTRAARAGAAEHASTARACRGWAARSYEEYHPYGSTAFHTASGAAQVSAKRYRYTGKEKDDETGLYYHGARYYAPWLGRWTAADPAGIVDGLNLYRYSRDNPINFSDPGGTQSAEFDQRYVGFESNINSDTGEASFSITVDLRNTKTGDAVFRSASGGIGSTGAIADQLATATGIGANLAPQERELLFHQLANFVHAGSAAEKAAGPQPAGLTHLGPGLERGVWGRNFRDRGYTLEHLYNNDIPKAIRATGDNRANYDIEDATHVKQIKSSNAGAADLRAHASKATRDAAKAVQENPTGTMAGKRPQAVVITPTDAPASAGPEIQAGYNRMRTPVPNSAPPEHVRGLPGAVGAAGKALTVGGTALSAVATGADLAAGDYPMAAADALTTVGGALEVYGLAVPGATVAAGVTAMSAGLVTAGVGIAAGSAISGVRAYRQGDTAGVVAGVAGVVAGVAMVAGVIAGAPVVVLGGVALAAAVGAFHLVRYLSR